MARTRIRSGGNPLNLTAALWDSVFLRACRGERTPYTPVWLMRQAGRYMPEYRAVRERHGFLDLCKRPELCAEVTVHARNWLGVDAAIIFSDILVVLEALGLPLRYDTGDGPVLGRPLRDAAAVAALRAPDDAVAALAFVEEAIRQTVRALPAGIPLIGFCGAPFTLASYAIEGGGSRQFTATKSFMYHQPVAWAQLMARLVDTLIPYLNRQIAAGATAVQIFDSWVGALTRADYRTFVAAHLARLVDGVTAGVPVIVFGTGTSHLLADFAATGCDVVGIDSTTDLGEGWSRCGGAANVAVQGNLDPCLLLAPRERLLAEARSVLAASLGRPGHVFNLGHGVFKDTDPAQAKALVEFVQGYRHPMVD